MAFETPRVTAYCVGERKDDAATRHPEWMTCEKWTHCDGIGGIVDIDDGYSEFFVAPGLHIWDAEEGYPPHLRYPIHEYTRWGIRSTGRIDIETSSTELTRHKPCFKQMVGMPVLWPLTSAQNVDPEEVGTNIHMMVDWITFHLLPTGEIKRVVLVLRETLWSTILRKVRENAWGAGMGLAGALAIAFLTWLVRKVR